MIPFPTTLDQATNLPTIVTAMENAQLDPTFVVAASELAHKDQGVYDLMTMWVAGADEKERAEILADIEDCLVEYTSGRVTKRVRPVTKTGRSP